MMAQAGKPKTNRKTPGKTAKTSPSSPPTGPPLSKEDAQKAAEAQAAADRRQALKDKTAAMLAKKKASQEELAKLNDDCTVLNEVGKFEAFSSRIYITVAKKLERLIMAKPMYVCVEPDRPQKASMVARMRKHKYALLSVRPVSRNTCTKKQATSSEKWSCRSCHGIAGVEQRSVPQRIVIVKQQREEQRLWNI